VGVTPFVVIPFDDPGVRLDQTAETTESDEAAVARGDSTAHLPLGRYLIVEQATQSKPDSEWQLLSVSCGNQLRAFAQGQAMVEVTAANPRQVCHFVNAPIRPPIPEPGPTPNPRPTPTPDPTPSPTPPQPSSEPQPDLVITKKAARSTVTVGRTVPFVIRVTNAGDATATSVVVNDRTGTNGQLVSARPSHGTCDERAPILTCRIGMLAPDETATIRVTVRATDTSVLTNVAVIGSGTLDLALRNNLATAAVRVRVRNGLPNACGSSATPVAHVAC
jgi:uncharacterized repeat protein (TIGR01451 family)